MAEHSRNRTIRRKELGRGERVGRQLYRLRLPLPFPGVPHCNAWAIGTPDELVLFDTGMYEERTLDELERALGDCGLRLEAVRRIVCTHAHLDHCGAAGPIKDRTGAEFLLHPNHLHMRRLVDDPQALLSRQLEVARQCGVPEETLRRYESLRRAERSEVYPIPEPDGELREGMVIETAVGPWQVYETPGHAPSHVCFYQPQQRLLISGDHLLGRVSLYFDYGYTPDPVGEFLDSLAKVERLGARLCLAGHGRTFSDVQAHIDATRELIAGRLRSLLAAVSREPLSAYELVPRIYGQPVSELNAHWLLSKVLCYLTHLRLAGAVEPVGGEPERWRATAAAPSLATAGRDRDADR